MFEFICGLLGHRWVALFYGASNTRCCKCCEREEIDYGKGWERWSRTRTGPKASEAGRGNGNAIAAGDAGAARETGAARRGRVGTNQD